MSDSLPALHRAEGHGKLGELVHRLVERAGSRGVLTESELRAELPAGLDAHLQTEVRTRLAVHGVIVVVSPPAGVDGFNGAGGPGAATTPGSVAIPRSEPNAGPGEADNDASGRPVVGLYVDGVAAVARRTIERPATESRGSGTSDPVRMYLKEIGRVSLLTGPQEVDLPRTN
jgi:hypothetical protein